MSSAYPLGKSLRFFSILTFIEILVLISWIPPSASFKSCMSWFLDFVVDAFMLDGMTKLILTPSWISNCVKSKNSKLIKHTWTAPYFLKSEIDLPTLIFDNDNHSVFYIVAINCSLKTKRLYVPFMILEIDISFIV